MRVSHHRQRDRQVDLLLIQLEDLGGLVIGPGGIDHQHAAAILDDQTVGSDCPENPACRDRKCAARHSVRAGENQIAKPLVASFHLLANRRADFTACTRSASRAAANAALSFATGYNIGQFHRRVSTFVVDSWLKGIRRLRGSSTWLR